MTGREKIAARIRALRAKTVANGCTEGEAMAAAAKVAELLAEHNMTLDEAELRASPFGRHSESHDDAVGERLWKVADGVQAMTGARYWKSAKGVWPVRIDFFGFDHEVEIAAYLLEICGGAMRREAKRLNAAFCLLTEAGRRRKIGPFLDGMADRLRIRLIELKPPAPTGRGLVVLHQDLVDAALADAGVRLRPRKERRSRDLDDSYRAGRAAANAVALNAGIRSRDTGGLLA